MKGYILLINPLLVLCSYLVPGSLSFRWLAPCWRRSMACSVFSDSGGRIISYISAEHCSLSHQRRSTTSFPTVTSLDFILDSFQPPGIWFVIPFCSYERIYQRSDLAPAKSRSCFVGSMCSLQAGCCCALSIFLSDQAKFVYLVGSTASMHLFGRHSPRFSLGPAFLAGYTSRRKGSDGNFYVS